MRLARTWQVLLALVLLTGPSHWSVSAAQALGQPGATGASFSDIVGKDVQSFANAFVQGLILSRTSTVDEGEKALESVLNSLGAGISTIGSSNATSYFAQAGQNMASLLTNVASGFSGMNGATNVSKGLLHLREITDASITHMNSSSADKNIILGLTQTDKIITEAQKRSGSIEQLVGIIQHYNNGGKNWTSSWNELQGVLPSLVNGTLAEPIYNNAVQFLNDQPGTILSLGRLLRLMIQRNQTGTPSFQNIIKSLLGDVSLASMASQTLASIEPNLTSTCRADIGQFFQELTQGHMWTLSMLDATGKIPRGIFWGNIQLVGNYDECREIDVTVTTSGGASSRRIQGGYYIINFAIDKRIIPDSMAALKYTPKVSIPWHVCLPRSCDKDNLNAVFAGRPLGSSGVNISYIQVKEPHVLTSADHGAVVTLVFLGLFILLVILGTTYDVIMLFSEKNAKKEEKKGLSETPDAIELHGRVNHAFHSSDMPSPGDKKTDMDGGIDQNGVHVIPKDAAFDSGVNGIHAGAENGSKNGQVWMLGGQLGERLDAGQVDALPPPKPPVIPRRSNRCVEALRGVLLSFSLRINTTKLFKMQHAPGSLTALNGIRVLSMAWVVYGHTMSFGLNTTENSLNAYKLMQNFFMQIMLNATYSVDTFFVLSGFLVAYLFLKESHKLGDKVTCKQMAYFYFHRYWRLTPALMAIIMADGLLSKYFGDGPFWTFHNEAQQFCEQNWWANLLYINNIVKDDKVCWGASWYLANDMQFYIISPLIIVPMIYGFFWIGYLLCAALVAVQIISSWYICYHYKITFMDPGGTANWMTMYYIKPYCRVGVYTIGMALGAFLYQKKMKVKMQRMSTALGWLVAMALMFTVSVVTYDSNKDYTSRWGYMSSSAFTAFSRPAWGLVIAWIILACTTGNGGFINSLLSWPGWLPFGRLSYGVYLVHITILSGILGGQRILSYFTFIGTIYQFLGVLVASFACSYVLNILVESPFIALESVILGRKRKQK